MPVDIGGTTNILCYLFFNSIFNLYQKAQKTARLRSPLKHFPHARTLANTVLGGRLL
jgi:hypothetical protein